MTPHQIDFLNLFLYSLISRVRNGVYSKLLNMFFICESERDMRCFLMFFSQDKYDFSGSKKFSTSNFRFFSI